MKQNQTKMHSSFTLSHTSVLSLKESLIYSHENCTAQVDVSEEQMAFSDWAFDCDWIHWQPSLPPIPVKVKAMVKMQGYVITDL